MPDSSLAVAVAVAALAVAALAVAALVVAALAVAGKEDNLTSHQRDRLNRPDSSVLGQAERSRACIPGDCLV